MHVMWFEKFRPEEISRLILQDKCLYNTIIRSKCGEILNICYNVSPKKNHAI